MVCSNVNLYISLILFLFILIKRHILIVHTLIKLWTLISVWHYIDTWWLNHIISTFSILISTLHLLHFYIFKLVILWIISAETISSWSERWSVGRCNLCESNLLLLYFIYIFGIWVIGSNFYLVLITSALWHSNILTILINESN